MNSTLSAGVTAGSILLTAKFADLRQALDANRMAVEASTAILRATAVVSQQPSFSLTFWPDMRCATANFEYLSTHAFAVRIKTAKADSKEALPSFSGGRFGSKRSPKNSLRHLANIVEVSAIVGDHDAGAMEPWQAEQHFKALGIRCLIYTTPSHRPEKPRWRIILPTSRPLTAAAYRRLVDKVDAILGGNVLADESRNAVQLWFFGSISDKPEPSVYVVPGPLAIDEEVDPEPAPLHVGDDDPLADMPSTSPLGLTADPEIVALSVAAIPNDGAPNWIEWNNLLLAIYAATDGSEEGREVAREWSAKNPVHDDAALDARWDHFRTSPPTRGGAGKLFHLAAKQGWQDPRRDAQPDTGGDVSNARRLADRMTGRFLFDRSARQWRRFDGVRWLPDWAAAIREAMDFADARVKEAARALSETATKEAERIYAQALAVHKAAPRIEAMLRLAQSDVRLVTSGDTFDSDPFILGVPNGAVDLRTGTLRDAKPGDRLTKIAGVRFRPDAQCPQWERFLAEVFQDDEETISFVRRALGYSLTGDVREEVLFFAHGSGRNGKSVFANILYAILGNYAATVGTELLARRRNDNEAARLKLRLKGARFVLANEVGEADRWDDRAVKEIVSREAISARALYGEAFEFAPTHHIWIRANHKPAALDSGDGFWRRLLLFPFERSFPQGGPEDLDKRILEAEGPGILAWAVRGCLEWQRDGLKVPDRLRLATEEYRNETDVLGQWFIEKVRKDPDNLRGVDARVAYDNVKWFFADAGLVSLSKPAFVRRVARFGMEARRSNGVQRFPGFSLTDDDDDLADLT